MDWLETIKGGVEGTFSVLGNVSDGAMSILGDWMELEVLRNENEAQGTNSYYQPPVNESVTTTTGMGSTSKMLLIGAAGVAGLGLFLSFKK